MLCDSARDNFFSPASLEGAENAEGFGFSLWLKQTRFDWLDLFVGSIGYFFHSTFDVGRSMFDVHFYQPIALPGRLHEL